MGNFPIGTHIGHNFGYSVGKLVGYNQNFNFCPSGQSNSIVSNMVHAGYLGNFTFGPPFVQQFMVNCVAKQEISTISLHFSGTLAITAMAFWEISIFSQQNLSFLKNAKWVM